MVNVKVRVTPIPNPSGLPTTFSYQLYSFEAGTGYTPVGAPETTDDENLVTDILASLNTEFPGNEPV